MHKAFALMVTLLTVATVQTTANSARAEDRLVVLELFTSQGCSRCPPAEEMIREMAQWPDVLPLSLHVDYWDFIGWEDTFALKANTVRQTAYAPRTQRRRLFTPLMVVGGLHMVEGYTPMQVVDHIDRHRDVDTGVRLTVQRDGAEFSIRAESAQTFPTTAVVLLVTYSPQERVTIERGENAGRAAVHTNVVTGWKVLGAWDGASPLEFAQPVPDQAAAVVVQAEGQGLVLAAARLR